MARKPIVIYSYVNPATGDTEVLDDNTFNLAGIDFDTLNASLGQSIRKHTVILRDRFTQAMQDIVNNGTVDNPAARPRLMFAQYVDSHDLPERDFSQNEPAICALASNILEMRVFPSLAGNPDFLAAVRTEQGQLARSLQAPESPASSSSSNGMNSIPA